MLIVAITITTAIFPNHRLELILTLALTAAVVALGVRLQRKSARAAGAFGDAPHGGGDASVAAATELPAEQPVTTLTGEDR